MITLLDAEPIHDLLTQGRRSKNSKTKTLSQWATKEIRKLKNANNFVMEGAVEIGKFENCFGIFAHTRFKYSTFSVSNF